MELNSIIEKSTADEPVTQQEAEYLINNTDFDELLRSAQILRIDHFKNRAHLCSIINARSGKCSEDCNFCAQSSYYQTDVQTYPLVDFETIYQKYRQSKNAGANCFSIVTSGKGAGTENDFENIVAAIQKIREEDPDIGLGASIGIITREQAEILKSAGLTRYHHNLETAESYFPEICSTHTYQQRIDTIINSREAGLQICCGGLLGLGESAGQRAEFALTLRNLKVDSIPLNFLNPIPGTRAHENYQPLSLKEMIRSIAVFRILNPDKMIGIIGGREVNFKDDQKLSQRHHDRGLPDNYRE